MEEITEDIEAAKEMLADPAQYDKDIIDVAFDAGYFGIKKFSEHFRKNTGMCPLEYRAFHTEFKRVTGMTPQEYRRQEQESVPVE